MMTNEHEKIEMLLPWFVTGQLDANEMVQVNAHVLACPECQLLLCQEYQLKKDVASIPVALPRFGMPTNMVSRRPSIGSSAWETTRRAVSRWSTKPLRVAAFATAQAAMLLIVFQFAQPTTEPSAEYRTLSSDDVASKANALVMFNPGTREADFRAILVNANAIIVGGPTEGNAYYLRIEPASRRSALESLRGNSKILLAQPIDGE